MDGSKSYHLFTEHGNYDVNPETVGQYTGLKDKNGVEIYEGDILKREFEVGQTVYDPISLGAMDFEIIDSGYFVGVVRYRPTEGWVLNKCKKYNEDDELVSKRSGVKVHSKYAELIGNEFEHPHLLNLPGEVDHE